MVVIGDRWGISTQCEHDFFKPIRRTVRSDDMVRSNGIDASLLGREIISEHKDTPVYDGQFSNQCYTDRVSEAFERFKSVQDDTVHPIDQWDRLVFHLPYAYHARRIFIKVFIHYLKETNQWQSFYKNHLADIPENDPDFERLITKKAAKTDVYKAFVKEKILPGEIASSLIGNLYTGSIFLSLISCLSSQSNKDLAGKRIGFFAYGSGSKSKVFEGEIMPGYQKQINQINLFDRLKNRIQITMDQYEYLHKKKLLYNLDSVERKIFQTSSGWLHTNRYARNYTFESSASRIG